MQQQLRKDQAAAQEITGKRDALDTRFRQDKVTASQFKLQSDQLNGEAEKAARRAGGNFRGRSAVRLMKLPEKFVAAAQIAIKSGRLKGEVLESLEEMATIENAVVITGIMAFYAGVHGTPFAPLALLLDTFLAASGGKDIALALQRIYLALDSARDEQGLNDAADVLIEELSGPLADGIVSLLMWGLGHAAGKVFGKKKKTEDADPTANTQEAPKTLPPLRQAYVTRVQALKDTAAQLLAAGKPPEEIARTVSQMRREIGIEFKNLTPADKLAEITARNLKLYGDELGPTVDWLRAAGKSWEQIIESASKPGGGDFDF